MVPSKKINKQINKSLSSLVWWYDTINFEFGRGCMSMSNVSILNWKVLKPS